jgi:hypothetical protein
MDVAFNMFIKALNQFAVGISSEEGRPDFLLLYLSLKNLPEPALDGTLPPRLLRHLKALFSKPASEQLDALTSFALSLPHVRDLPDSHAIKQPPSPTQLRHFSGLHDALKDLYQAWLYNEIQGHFETLAALGDKEEWEEGTLASVRYRDNSTGDRHILYTLAEYRQNQWWFHEEPDSPLLSYQGDAVLRVWPITNLS